MDRDLCPWWTIPVLLALAACVLCWGGVRIPAPTNRDVVFGAGVVCAFLAVRSFWREAPGVVRLGEIHDEGGRR